MRTRPHNPLPGSLATLLFLCAACGPGDESTGVPADEDRILGWTPVEKYSVGGFDAPDWATFGEIGDLGFDGEGNLYVFDDQLFQITVVSPEGRFLRSFGGRGDGPGEIGRPLAMSVFDDGRVAISDLGKRGIALFDATGEWSANIPLDMTAEGLPGPDMMAHPDGWVVSAQPLRVFLREDPEESAPGAEDPETRPVYLYPVADGPEAFELYEAWDPPEPPAEDGVTMEAGSGGSRMSFKMSALLAFEPGLHVAVLRDGRLAVVDSTDYRIRILESDGTEVEEWRRPVRPSPVTDRIREMERERRLMELEGDGSGEVRVIGGGGPGISFDQAQFQEAMRERVEGMSFYPEVPAIRGIQADGAGRLWVERPGSLPGEEGLVDLLSPEGAYLGSLPAGRIGDPQAFGPGGLVAVVETDDFDVATIRVLEVPTGDQEEKEEGDPT